jgi:hypothetical protein
MPSGHFKQFERSERLSWPSKHLGQFNPPTIDSVTPSLHNGQLFLSIFAISPFAQTGQFEPSSFINVASSAHFGHPVLLLSVSVTISGHLAQFDLEASAKVVLSKHFGQLEPSVFISVKPSGQSPHSFLELTSVPFAHIQQLSTTFDTSLEGHNVETERVLVMVPSG